MRRIHYRFVQSLTAGLHQGRNRQPPHKCNTAGKYAQTAMVWMLRRRVQHAVQPVVCAVLRQLLGGGVAQ